MVQFHVYVTHVQRVTLCVTKYIILSHTLCGATYMYMMMLSLRSAIFVHGGVHRVAPFAVYDVVGKH